MRESRSANDADGHEIVFNRIGQTRRAAEHNSRFAYAAIPEQSSRRGRCTRRQRADVDGSLHREYRQGAIALPGAVQGAGICGRIACEMDGAHPHELVQAHLDLDSAMLKSLHKNKQPVVQSGCLLGQ